MTALEFKKLKIGTRVQWREGPKSPRAGEVTEFGTVKREGRRTPYVLWSDNQRTEGFDDWALQCVEITPEAHA